MSNPTATASASAFAPAGVTLTAKDWAAVCQSVLRVIEYESWVPYTLPVRPAVAWIDTTPMLSLHEHCGAVVDWHRTVLAFAVQHRIVAVHPQHPHLVRVINEEPI